MKTKLLKARRGEEAAHGGTCTEKMRASDYTGWRLTAGSLSCSSGLSKSHARCAILLLACHCGEGIAGFKTGH
eukprot:2783353-Rhodomonas_salina.2